LTFRAMPTSL